MKIRTRDELTIRELHKRNQLVINNVSLAHYWGRRYTKHSSFPNLMDREDAVQEAMVGLIAAADRYTKTKGKKIEGYIYDVLKWKFSEIARDKNNWKTVGSEMGINKIVSTDTGNDRLPLDRQESVDIINKAISRIPKRYAYVLTNLNGIGTPKKTMRDMAKEMGVSRIRVEQINRKARAKLCRQLHKHQLDI